LLPLVFETSASTNSATRAIALRTFRAAKIKGFFVLHKKITKSVSINLNSKNWLSAA